MSVVKLVDKRFLFNDKPAVVVAGGVKDITIQRDAAETYTDSTLRFHVKAPGFQYGMKRELLCHYYVMVSVSGPADDWLTDAAEEAIDLNTLSEVSSVMALRSYPLHSVANNMEVSMNSRQLQWEPAHWLDALRRYDQTATDLESAANSSWPTMLDDISDYNLGKDSAWDPIQTRGRGAGRHTPLPRGAFIPVYAAQDATDKKLYYIAWEVWEPLVFPKLFGTQAFEDAVVIGLNALDVKLSFINGMRRILSTSFKNAANREGVTVNAVQFASAQGQAVKPELITQWFTLPSDVPIPKQIAMPYVDFTTDVVKGGLLAPGGSVTLSSNSMFLDAIPYAVAVYVNDDITQATMGGLTSGGKAAGDPSRYPDVYASITGVRISFENRSNILQSLDEVALHQIATRNGFAHDWFSWHANATGSAFDDDPSGDQAGGCGSVLILKFGDDIPLDGLYPTQGGSFRFRITVDAVNRTGHDFSQVALYTAFLYDGMVINTPEGQFISDRITTSASEFASLKPNMELSRSAAIHDKMIRGHGLLDFFRSVGNTLSGLLRRGVQLVKGALPGFVGRLAEGKPLKQAAAETAGEVAKSKIDEAISNLSRPRRSVAVEETAPAESSGGRRRRLRGGRLALTEDIDLGI